MATRNARPSQRMEKEKDHFQPQMTPLIDILTLLLVFLIQSFSAEGNLITPSADLQLPQTSSKTAPVPALTVELTQNGVFSDGVALASRADVENTTELQIAPLYAWLKIKRTQMIDTAQDHPVIIQCDRDLEFSIVKRVMFTLSKAGYTDFSVLAIEE